jgi:homoserine O-acetyltransferase/O-succinyltransferase
MSSTCVIATPENSLPLSNGESLPHGQLAYETFGTLNPAQSNAILVCHALTGDSHCSGGPKEEAKQGWWNDLIGPDKAIDTNRYFVICSNVLGGCKGSTGPSSINPETGEPYGLTFPVITVADMVQAQARLVIALGIEKLLAVVGGSIGGFQALEWSILFPNRVQSALVIASAGRVSAQGIAFNAVGRHAILNDPAWQEGRYYRQAAKPEIGLATARMLAHITYLSEAALEQKFGRRLQSAAELQFEFANEFAVESYLAYQGQQFIRRFDANSYLYLTKAMDYFDLGQRYGSLGQAFTKTEANFLVVSYASDWLFTTEDSKALVRALRQQGKPVAFTEIESQAGHDGFLVDWEPLAKIVAPFLDQQWVLRNRGKET